MSCLPFAPLPLPDRESKPFRIGSGSLRKGLEGKRTAGLPTLTGTTAHDPCFCDGPWEDDDDGSAQCPSLLDREHEVGSHGCRYPRSVEWVRRARAKCLPVRVEQ